MSKPALAILSIFLLAAAFAGLATLFNDPDAARKAGETKVAMCRDISGQISARRPLASLPAAHREWLLGPGGWAEGDMEVVDGWIRAENPGGSNADIGGSPETNWLEDVERLFRGGAPDRALRFVSLKGL